MVVIGLKTDDGDEPSFWVSGIGARGVRLCNDKSLALRVENPDEVLEAMGPELRDRAVECIFAERNVIAEQNETRRKREMEQGAGHGSG